MPLKKRRKTPKRKRLHSSFTWAWIFLSQKLMQLSSIKRLWSRALVRKSKKMNFSSNLPQQLTKLKLIRTTFTIMESERKNWLRGNHSPHKTLSWFPKNRLSSTLFSSSGALNKMRRSISHQILCLCMLEKSQKWT